MQLVEASFQVVSLDLPWHLFLAVRNTSVENLRSTELSGLFHTTLILHVFIYSYSSLLYKLKATPVSEVRQKLLGFVCHFYLAPITVQVTKMHTKPFIF